MNLFKLKQLNAVTGLDDCGALPDERNRALFEVKRLK